MFKDAKQSTYQQADRHICKYSLELSSCGKIREIRSIVFACSVPFLCCRDDLDGISFCQIYSRQSVLSCLLLQVFHCFQTVISHDRVFSFERNCVLRQWESETLK